MDAFIPGHNRTQMCALMTMYRIWYHHKDVHMMLQQSQTLRDHSLLTPPPAQASHFLTCPTPRIHFSYAASATAPIFPESKNIWPVVYFQWPFRGSRVAGSRARSCSPVSKLEGGFVGKFIAVRSFVGSFSRSSSAAAALFPLLSPSPVPPTDYTNRKVHQGVGPSIETSNKGAKNRGGQGYCHPSICISN